VVEIDHLVPETFWHIGLINGPFQGAGLESGDIFFPGWTTGDFSMVFDGEPKIYYRAQGVEIERGLLLKALPGLGEFLGRGEGAIEKGKDRSPSVKRGRAPEDDAIQAKADEMKGRGMTSYKIAGEMRKEPGFENVPTVRVRELIRGRWPRGRPKKKA
jgi:hypothetical protein